VPKHKIIPLLLVLLICFSAGQLARMMTFQSCILASDSGRSEETIEEQRKRDTKKRLEELKRQEELREELRRQRKEEGFRREIARRWPESAQKRKQQWLQSDQRRKELKIEIEKTGGIRFLYAKNALGASEEQWKLIRPKLGKVDNLWNQVNSTIEAGVSGGSTSGQTEAIVPKLQWGRPWKYTPLFEMTDAQRLARQLRALLEKKSTTPQAFRRQIAGLRKARTTESEIKKQLAEARRELREILTTRQEAILILLGWL
jgi:hypothetical protein